MTQSIGLTVETTSRRSSPGGGNGSLKEAVVTLTDGRTARGRVVAFNLPDELMVLNVAGDSPSSTSALPIPFRHLLMAAFLADPSRSDPDRSFTRRSKLITLRLADGRELHGITETLAEHRPGLFLVPVDADWYERLFVPLASIREILDARPLDDIVPGRSVVSLRDVQARMAKPQAGSAARIGSTPNPPAAATLLSGGPSTASPGIPIGRVLVEQGFLTEAELADIVSEQRTRGGRLGEVAVAMGFATHKMIGVALAVQFSLPFTDLSDHVVDPRLRAIIPPELAHRWRVLPLGIRDDVLTVAIDDPTNLRPIDALRRHAGLDVARTVAPASSVDRALREYDPN